MDAALVLQELYKQVVSELMLPISLADLRVAATVFLRLRAADTAFTLDIPGAPPMDAFTHNDSTHCAVDHQSMPNASLWPRLSLSLYYCWQLASQPASNDPV